MKYIFAGGGTGGHIFPAIAVADEIRKTDNEAEILFIGAKGRIEEKIVPSNNYRLETIELSGFDRSNVFRNLKLPVKLIRSFRKCMRILKDFSPDVVIGTGGFVCGPVIYAAGLLKIPTLIQEGNSFAGKTIKFLAERSDKVVINFPETEKYLKRKDNIIRIPHPIRSSLKVTEKSKAVEAFEMSPMNKTIFIFGGSQGARGINRAVEKIAFRLSESGINIIWQTGKTDFTDLKSRFTGSEKNIRILEFIDNIDIAYSAADLVICRAGITSIMELASMQKACILIPLPGSAENHQEMNALNLAEKNAAVMIRENGIDDKLYTEIINIIHNEKKITELSENINKFADPDSARKIADEAIRLIKK